MSIFGQPYTPTNFDCDLFQRKISNEKCKKVYFIWVTRSEKHFEWLLEVIRLAEAWDVTLKTHIFITEKEQNYDLRTLMRFLLESKLKCPTGRSLFTGLRAETHFGRPKFNDLLELIMQENPSTGKIGVFRNDFENNCLGI